MKGKEQLIKEWNNSQRIKKARKSAIIEAGILLAVSPIYILTGNWAALILVGVILMQIHLIYMFKRLFLLSDTLLDGIIAAMKKVEADMIAEDKTVKFSKKGKK